MKCRERHAVHLTDRALGILEGQADQNDTFVFPSTVGRDAPMSNMALSMTLRRLGVQAATVHGFRSTFSTWANELGIAKPDATEAASAHREEKAVRRAYKREHFLAERRALMIAWDDFLAGRPVRRSDGTAVKDAAVLHAPTQHAAKARSPRRGQGSDRGGSDESAQSSVDS
jgi:hypothetical protein